MESRDIKQYPIKVNGINVGVIMTNTAWECNKTSDDPVTVVFTPRLSVPLARLNLPFTMEDQNVRNHTNITPAGNTRLQTTPNLLTSTTPNIIPNQNTPAPRIITPESLDGAIRNATSTSTKTRIETARRRSSRFGIKTEYTDENSEDKKPPTKRRRLFIKKRTSRIIDRPINPTGGRRSYKKRGKKESKKGITRQDDTFEDTEEEYPECLCDHCGCCLDNYETSDDDDNNLGLRPIY